MTRINCFIPAKENGVTGPLAEALAKEPMVNKVYPITRNWCTDTIRWIARHSDADYSLIYTKEEDLMLGQLALERMVNIADDSSAGMLYADRNEQKNGELVAHPVIAYQKGSLRDDFDFGSVLFYRSEYLREAAAAMDVNYHYAALYDLRLRVSEKAPLVHLNEYLYTEIERDTRKSGEKNFDYVDPKNRAVQLEMEKACTEHLKRIGGYLKPEFEKIDFGADQFPVEATVVIPVRNRIRTIADAIQSVLSQETKSPFNLIIVDNHSTDGTTEKIDEFKDERLIHIVPERNDLGIGGCWDCAVYDARCGKFAVQLDSDDVYADSHTLQKVVDAFYEQQCAMVIGSYRMTNFNMETIPPGIIDHKEWTPENGRNNALRINGLGAPRAFWTPMLRRIGFPNTSYGEDYAIGLRISREYQIGRIYDVLYLCRRWDDNSDAALSVEKINRNNLYKDSIRTWELEARLKMLSHE
jgi:hypothetical protein